MSISLSLEYKDEEGQDSEPLIHQRALHQCLAPAVLLCGGWGSGKSEAVALEAWRRTWLFPGSKHLFVADSHANLVRWFNGIAHQRLPRAEGQDGDWRSLVHNRPERCPLVARTDFQARWVRWVNGSVWMWAYGNTIASMEGRNAHWVWGDELRLWTMDPSDPQRDAYTVARSRARLRPRASWDGSLHPSGEVPGPQFIGATIPEVGPLHQHAEDGRQCAEPFEHGEFKGLRVCCNVWTKATDEDPAQVDTVVIHCSSKDNPHISQTTYNAMRSRLDTDKQRQILEGLWGSPAGAIYPAFGDTLIDFLPVDQLPADLPLDVAVDFGKQTGHAIYVVEVPPQHKLWEWVRRAAQHAPPRPGESLFVVVDECLIDAALGAQAHALETLRRHGQRRIRRICGDQQGVQVQKTDDSSQMRDWEAVIRQQRHVQARRVTHERNKLRTRVENGITLIRSMLRDGDGFTQLYCSRALIGRRYDDDPHGRKRLGYYDAMRQYRRDQWGRIPRQPDHPCDTVRYYAVNYLWSDDRTATFGRGLADLTRRR